MKWDMAVVTMKVLKAEIHSRPKRHISVSEWGTEAGSVAVEWLLGDAGVKPVDEVYFYADHPFAFVIGEETSGTILFEGVVMEP